MTEVLTPQENIYSLNFTDRQITFLRESKIGKKPTLMYVVQDFSLFIKKPAYSNGSEHIIVKKRDRISIYKSQNHAIIEGKNKDESFKVIMKWQDYEKLTKKNTYVPIAVFTIN